MNSTCRTDCSTHIWFYLAHLRQNTSILALTYAVVSSPRLPAAAALLMLVLVAVVEVVVLVPFTHSLVLAVVV